MGVRIAMGKPAESMALTHAIAKWLNAIQVESAPGSQQRNEMMTFEELRRAIEAINDEIDLIETRGHAPRYARKRTGKALAILATLEREHAERERRLREGALAKLDQAFCGRPDLKDAVYVYDEDGVYSAHETLAEILDAPQKETPA